MKPEIPESLESRMLLSSTLANGTLLVTGTPGADRIDITLAGTQIVVDEHNGSAPAKFGQLAVSMIVVDAGKGDDVVTMAPNVIKPAGLLGGDGADRLTGGAGNDSLSGGNGVDVLVGSRGDDTFGGGGSSDAIDGGAGNDTVDYSGRSSPVSARLVNNLDGDVFAGVTGSGGQVDVGEHDNFANVETIIGGSGNDTLSVTDANSVNGGIIFPSFLLDGLGGNDTLSISGTTDENNSTAACTLKGGDGNDTFTYSTVALQQGPKPMLFGEAGDDTFIQPSDDFGAIINGGPGIDTEQHQLIEGTVTMGPGVERLIAIGRAPHFIVGNELNNYIELRNANSRVNAGAGNDTILATGSSDAGGLLDGGNGDDYISGAGTLHGGAGNDTLHGTAGTPEILSGDAGIDTADFSDRGYSLNITLNDKPDDGPRFHAGEHDNVHSDIENVIGGKGNDYIVGTFLNNRLEGGPGNDTIWAGDGNDTLIGGPGADALFGQGGKDTFFARDGTRDTVNGGLGLDSAQADNGTDLVQEVETILA